MLRDPKNDKLKEQSRQDNEQYQRLTCKIGHCQSLITPYRGPGSQTLCREHQLQLREYGGLGRMDRPWSFSKSWTCELCGYDPKSDPFYSSVEWDSEEHMYRAMRSTLVADHKHRQVDGGTDHPDNIQTLCQTCNAKKTILQKDYVKKPKRA